MVYIEERAELYTLFDDVELSVVQAFLQDVKAGNIIGSHYHITLGRECGCIYGTVAFHELGAWGDDDEYGDDRLMFMRGEDVDELTQLEWLAHDVVLGDTPETSPALAKIAQWTEEYIAAHAGNIPATEKE